MKKLVAIFAVMLLASVGFAQDWEFSHVLWMYNLPVSDSYGMHGVTVDPNGNIWFAMYNYPTDTLYTATDTVEVYGLRCVNPAGEELPFSPVQIVTIGGVPDTLKSSCRGLATDNNGNILHAVAGFLYRFNYQDGTGMDKYDFPNFTGSLTKPACDANGNIFIGTVGPGNPVKMLNPDFTEKGNAITALAGCYNRTIAVSPDGKELYFGSTWNGLGIRHFHSDIPGVLEFTPVDTFGNKDKGDGTEIKFWAEDVTYGRDGNLYAANTQMEWSDSTRGSLYWVFNAATGEEKYSLGIQKGDPLNGGIWNGRGAAWSPDGETMYLADFGYNSVTVWNYVGVGISDKGKTLPVDFKLYQNYPNPFNPSTIIPFALEKNGLAELKIYDILGREVTTLMKQPMSVGYHKVTFDATGLPSGVYYYRLTVDGELQTKQMIYMK